MGNTDSSLFPFYKKHIHPKGQTALLGFVNNNWFDGDLYDLQLNNWNINDEWKLNKKYDTIISLRCPYFAKDPEDFIKRCYDNLNDGGVLYADWGLGDHWRFPNYKVGWVKDGEQEHAYGESNYLWSTVWDASFLDDIQYQLFNGRVTKFGYDYDNMREVIYKEVPSVLELNTIKKYFDISYNIITFYSYLPQLYILVQGVKKG